MLIDKARIEARLAQLKAQSDKLRADLNAVGGAIQDCEFWLEQLEKPEEETK